MQEGGCRDVEIGGEGLGTSTPPPLSADVHGLGKGEQLRVASDWAGGSTLGESVCLRLLLLLLLLVLLLLLLLLLLRLLATVLFLFMCPT
jgi:hypothetical protein